MPVIEIESDWRETGIGCIHCGEMTYSDGGTRQCVDPGCPFFALHQPELVADPKQVDPPSANKLDGDDYTYTAPAFGVDDLLYALETIRARAESWHGRATAPFWNLGDIATASLKKWNQSHNRP